MVNNEAPIWMSGHDVDLSDFVEEVHYAVESRHHILGTQCLCGYQSFVKREMTKHIVTETLIAAGLDKES